MTSYKQKTNVVDISLLVSIHASQSQGLKSETQQVRAGCYVV